jgi:hypothetical protein
MRMLMIWVQVEVEMRKGVDWLLSYIMLEGLWWQWDVFVPP